MKAKYLRWSVFTVLAPRCVSDLKRAQRDFGRMQCTSPARTHSIFCNVKDGGFVGTALHCTALHCRWLRSSAPRLCASSVEQGTLSCPTVRVGGRACGAARAFALMAACGWDPPSRHGRKSQGVVGLVEVGCALDEVGASWQFPPCCILSSMHVLFTSCT